MASDDTSEWSRAHAVKALAKTRPDPDALLSALRDLQSISEDKKHRTLDELSKIFALDSIERPTLAECRAAIGSTDAPHPIRNWFKEPATEKTIEALVAFMIDALGCSDEPLSGSNAAPIDRAGWKTFTASSAEHVSATAGRVETESCSIETTRNSTFFPGDVNEPPWEHEYIVVEGKRRDESLHVRVSFRMGDTEMSMRVLAPHEQRDRMLMGFWRAFTK
jgi:hypothetical protein